MIKVGITGGIGSGKSVVSHILRIMGYPVYVADTEAKSLMNKDMYIREELIRLFGTEIYKGDILDRTRLASVMFSDSKYVHQVNSIVHPRVRADFQRWVKEQDSDIVFIESAILYEASFQTEVDVVMAVSAPVEVRIRRAMKRDSATRDSILKRICHQANDEEKEKRAQFVIYNDDESVLLPQLLQLITLLSQNNNYLCQPKP